ncbi:MAG: signal peptide peptidase SppA [Chloroflexi bacterium]|nr:signal peptide peptidase SppA [Chloroflexota bacterium]
MNNRPNLWAFGAFIAGLLVPVLSCAALMIAAGFALGQMGSGVSGLPSSGVTVGAGPGVALISVEGTITSGSATPFTTGVAASDDILDEIKKAKDDREAKAILLKVNSPGGGAVASDEIYHALKGAGKPIVVVMGDLAASGGYYISMAGDWIIANPNTLTGSIGVISAFPNAQRMLDKVGVEIVTIKSGPAKDTGSPFREMTDAEQARWQSLIDEVYSGFVQVVVDGRHMTEGDVRKLADGSVYTGKQALELGLVDALGYEEDAIAKAAELGGITGKPRIIKYHRQPTLFDVLNSAASSRSLLPTPKEVSDWLGWPTISFVYR